MRPGLPTSVAVLAVALSACSSSLDLPSITGLWVGASELDGGATSELALDVAYVGDVSEGCWSADGPAGLLPVRWPAGTRVGLEAALELGDDLTVADGDAVTARGTVQPPVGTRDRFAGELPDGCALDEGFYDLSDVAAG